MKIKKFGSYDIPDCYIVIRKEAGVYLIFKDDLLLAKLIKCETASRSYWGVFHSSGESTKPVNPKCYQDVIDDYGKNGCDKSAWMQFHMYFGLQHS